VFIQSQVRGREFRGRKQQEQVYGKKLCIESYRKSTIESELYMLWKKTILYTWTTNQDAPSARR